MNTLSPPSAKLRSFSIEFIVTGLMFLGLLLINLSANAQAASATWTLTSSNTAAIVGAVTAPAPSMGSSNYFNFSLDPTYGFGGQGWSTSSSAPAATASEYIQFQISPTAGNNLTITTCTLISYNNEGVPPDKLIIYASTSSTFASGVSTVANPTNVTSYSAVTTTATGLSLVANSGQTLYIRVMFYYAGCACQNFGARKMTLSGTTAVACTAPSISASSLSAQTVCQAAASTALTVTPAGSSPYTYQWFSNPTASNVSGTNLGSANGAQTASFTPPTTSSATTFYYCVVTGQCAPVATSAASGAITVQSNTNNVGAIGLSSVSQCVGGSPITVSNTTSATTGSPASTGPNYNFYYNLNGTGWVSFQNTTTATATLPAIVTNTIGTNQVVRNSYWGCASEANNANTLLTITIKGPAVTNSPATGVGTNGATLNGTD